MSVEKVWRDCEVCPGMRFRWFEAVGKASGPSLTLIGGQHGMEPAGPAIISKLLNDLDLSDLNGTLRAVPMAFVEALRGGRECAFPEATLAEASAVGMKWGLCPWELNRSTCGRNLNRLWPGKLNGSPHERLVGKIWEKTCAAADYLVDFHCWADFGPPGCLVYDQAGLDFARIFGLSHIFECGLKDPPGICTYAASRAGKTSFTVELTPQNRLTLEASEQGRRGILNLLHHLEMLPGDVQLPKEQYLISWANDQPISITLDWDAIMLPELPGGAWCRQGDRIGVAIGLDDPARQVPVLAPAAGILSSTLERSVITAGKPLVGFWPAQKLEAI